MSKAALIPFVKAFEQKLETRSSTRSDWNGKMPDEFTIMLKLIAKRAKHLVYLFTSERL